MKLIRVSKVVCNSHFTKKIIDQEFRVKSEVLYPPVDVEKIKPKRKENTILFVGRFSQLKQSKNQHVLITAFKKFLKKHSNWKLVLVGGVEIGGEEYFQRLNREIEGYEENITLVKSPTYKELLDYYGKAKFFWSAVGFGIDENKDPEKVEHFGITLVEAMSAGCVPLVFRAGGYKEIISEGSGLFWKKEKELVDLTEKLINGPYLKLKSVSQNAVARSKIFSYNNFSTNFLKLI
jgi:glycosyltransferase involved in cell wall biosynthesis